MDRRRLARRRECETGAIEERKEDRAAASGPDGAERAGGREPQLMGRDPRRSPLRGEERSRAVLAAALAEGGRPRPIVAPPAAEENFGALLGAAPAVAVPRPFARRAGQGRNGQ